jgi:activator of HSP90 ATPase
MRVTLSRRQILTGAASIASAWALPPRSSAAESDANGISHTAESIHQEPFFQASRAKIYHVLTDPQQFDRVVTLSDAMKAPEMQKMPAKPCVIGRHEGSAFALFAGFITGRQLKLIPGQLIVQAWRAEDWPAGAYSIVSFKLVESSSGTKILFDHLGFPAGEAGQLASGWRGNYWNPMTQVLA